MENIMNDLINKQVQKINAEKERLIIARIRIMIGEEINLEKEVQKIFPRIGRKYSQIDNSEIFIWNDGSEFGREIITFCYPYIIEPNYDYDNMKVTFGIKYK